MHPTLKLIGWTIAPLVLSLPISILMSEQNGWVIAQESVSEKKAEGDLKAKADQLFNLGIQQAQGREVSLIGQLYGAIEYWEQALAIYREIQDRRDEVKTLMRIGSAHYQSAEYMRVMKTGDEEYKLSEYNEALTAYQQAADVFQEIQDQSGKAVALTVLGDVYSRLSDYVKASEAYRQASNIFHRLQDRDSEAVCLNNLGFSYYSLSQHTRSIEVYQKALPLFQQAKNNAGIARTLNNLGKSYSALKERTQAISFYERALPIFRELQDKGSEALLLKDLGYEYFSLDQYLSAIKFYEQALPIYQKVKLSNFIIYQEIKADEANVLVDLGTTYNEISQYAKSLELYQQALPIYQQVGDLKGVANVLINLGNTYNNMSQYTKASELYQQALQICQQIKDKHGQASSLSGLGESYRLLSQYSKSLKFNQQALVTYQQIQDLEGEAISFLNLGNTYKSLAQYDKAILHYQKALSYSRKAKSYKGEAKALFNLGNVHLSLSIFLNPMKTIEYYQQALSIFRRIKNLNEESNVLMSIGNVYLAKSQYNQAILYYQQALPIFQKVQDKRGEVIILTNIGSAYKLISQHGKAIEYYQRALLILQSVRDYRTKGKILENLGSTLLEKNNVVEAEKILLESVDISESLRLELDDDQRRSLFEVQTGTYNFLQKAQIALRKIEAALETSDRGRARAFIELLAARFAGETLENAIAKQKVEKLSITQIKQVSKAQAATLVQYSIVSDKDLYVYVVQPNGGIQFRQVNLTTLGKSLADFVNTSRDGLGVRGRTGRADILVALSPEKQRELQEQRDLSLHQLHQLLIEPIADLLPKNENDHVIFMPQGELFLIPFPALLNAQNQPLITQHTILTAPSIQTLDLTHKTAQKRLQGSRPALVVGNPTMPAVSTIIGNPPTKLTQLPGSEREATTIAQQLNTQAITGANARKDVVMQKMQNAGIIHLATHGLLDSFKGDTPGAIALAPNGNGDRNDGLLTSGEIFDLKLNADLVVLSACDTGRGDITGDGVIGLSRSLFVAGVPSVIVSLWKVPDDSTALLMTEFYKNWQDRKLDKAQALRQAMLTTMKTNPNPRDWAAFTLIGEAE